MKIIMSQLKDAIILEPIVEDGYIVHVPALNGLTTEGDTVEEANTYDP